MALTEQDILDALAADSGGSSVRTNVLPNVDYRDMLMNNNPAFSSPITEKLADMVVPFHGQLQGLKPWRSVDTGMEAAQIALMSALGPSALRRILGTNDPYSISRGLLKAGSGLNWKMLKRFTSPDEAGILDVIRDPTWLESLGMKAGDILTTAGKKATQFANKLPTVNEVFNNLYKKSSSSIGSNPLRWNKETGLFETGEVPEIPEQIPIEFNEKLGQWVEKRPGPGALWDPLGLNEIKDKEVRDMVENTMLGKLPNFKFDVDPKVPAWQRALDKDLAALPKAQGWVDAVEEQAPGLMGNEWTQDQARKSILSQHADDMEKYIKRPGDLGFRVIADNIRGPEELKRILIDDLERAKTSQFGKGYEIGNMRRSAGSINTESIKADAEDYVKAAEATNKLLESIPNSRREFNEMFVADPLADWVEGIAARKPGFESMPLSERFPANLIERARKAKGSFTDELTGDSLLALLSGNPRRNEMHRLLSKPIREVLKDTRVKRAYIGGSTGAGPFPASEELASIASGRPRPGDIDLKLALRKDAPPGTMEELKDKLYQNLRYGTIPNMAVSNPEYKKILDALDVMEAQGFGVGPSELLDLLAQKGRPFVDFHKLPHALDKKDFFDLRGPEVQKARYPGVGTPWVRVKGLIPPVAGAGLGWDQLLGNKND